MLNPRENMIVINGVIKTVEIHSINLNQRGDKYNIFFKSSQSKCFSYSWRNVSWLTNPDVLDPQVCKAFYRGREVPNVLYIAAFRDYFHTYWFIEYKDGTSFGFCDDEIVVKVSCLDDKDSKSVFGYLSNVAAINRLKSEDNGVPLLFRQYQDIDFINDESAIAPYLNPKKFKLQKFVASKLIYPFGCNASQQKAVQTAFENQISIIQGPPGTGKTQTILNIVANILCQGKTVMVVSNNNSAITNVVEKLERYGLGFITALLGSRENKNAFIAAQQTEKVIPADIDQWHSIEADKTEYLANINHQSKALADVFAKQERLALARQELDALKVECTHFEQEVECRTQVVLRKQLSSVQLMTLWNELQAVIEGV